MSPQMLSGAALLAATSCAGLMGFAIQRGATCTVAAVDELLTQRRAHRLLAMLEAALWVLGGLLLARLFLDMPRMPSAYALSVSTVIGGALLGLGAYVNRACVFGALARLGSGDSAYVLTPLGFLAGYAWFYAAGWMAAGRLTEPPPVLQLSMNALTPLLIPVGALMLWRLASLVRLSLPWARRSSSDADATPALWSPHSATLVIGITFFAMFTLAGPWAYTDVLAELAATLKGGMSPAVLTRAGLMLALFGGAVIGGWTSGRFEPVPLTAAGAARCLAGGALMGMGSALIPGGNDGLVLMGLPLLWPYAWVAFLTMGTVIALAILTRQRLFSPTPSAT